MSLKTIHIVFIMASILLSGGFCAWGVHDHSVSKSVLNLWMGIGSGLATGLLIVYLGMFISKMNKIRKAS